MPDTPRIARIDAHHHLWRFNKSEFAWIDDPMSDLRRDFLPTDLVETLKSAEVDASIAVQARQTIEETSWLLEQAHSTPVIAGVVGWLPLLADDLTAHLDLFADRPKFVGAREIVQAEPAGFLDQTAFDQGIDRLTERDLTYDLLIRADQLDEAIRFVDRHPHQRFVLDHAAKPLIAKGILEPWRTSILDLGRRPNIACKISGLVTEAKWQTWTEDDLGPYLDVCVEAFGTSRLLTASDWPVCLVASSYNRWWQTLDRYFASFTADERNSIFVRNAVRSYRLKTLDAAPESPGSSSPERQQPE